MLKVLCLTALIATACAVTAEKEEAAQAPEPNPAESAAPVIIDQDARKYDFLDGLELSHYRDSISRMRSQDRHHSNRVPKHHHDDDRHFGPVILRTNNLHSPRHPDIERQNRIIADVYSPDYYQPQWILDYRYQKTGGRDYTRGPGGQILILPKNVRTKERKEFDNFDSLLEHLRLSRLSEKSRLHKMHEDHHEGHHGQHDSWRQQEEHGRGWWNPYHKR